MPAGKPTSQNFPEFRWTRPREEAALAVAADEVSDEEIASQAGVSRRQLTTWKQHPVFVARVEEHRAAWRQAVMAQGIADRVNRVRALQDRWERMQRVIDQRAEAMPEDVPGANTGLLVRTEKQIGGGPNAMHVVEYAVDTGLLKELRAHEEQAAKELGQWAEKIDIRHILDREVERVAAERGIPREQLAAEVDVLIAEGTT